MSQWEMVSIPDYLFFQEGPGVRNTQYTSSGVKLLNVANLQNGKIDLSTSDRYISETEAYGRYNHFLVDDGDFIIASSGIKVDYFEKKMGFIQKNHLPLCMNTSTIRFKAHDSAKLDMRYFMYYLKTIHFKKQLAKYITGSAQLNFGPSHLNQMHFPLPPLGIQQKIAHTLDTVSEILALRKKQLEEMDGLIQSIFYEMFGDPVLNEKGWDVKKLGDVGSFKCGGTPSRSNPEYFKGNIPWITTVSLNKIEIGKKDAIEFISADAVTNSATKIIQPFSLMIGVRVGVGKVSINKEPMCTSQDIISIENIDKRLNITFLLFIIRMFQNYFDSQKRGATIQGINISILKDLLILLPPIELQNHFSDVVQKIEEEKELIQKSIDETQYLLDCLMSQYFD